MQLSPRNFLRIFLLSKGDEIDKYVTRLWNQTDRVFKTAQWLLFLALIDYAASATGSRSLKVLSVLLWGVFYLHILRLFDVWFWHPFEVATKISWPKGNLVGPFTFLASLAAWLACLWFALRLGHAFTYFQNHH